MRTITCIRVIAFVLFNLAAGAQGYSQSGSPSSSPISVFVNDRTRVDAWQWFAAPPKSNSYAYVESLLRIGVAEHIRRWDWELELSQPTVLDAPDGAVSPVTA